MALMTDRPNPFKPDPPDGRSDGAPPVQPDRAKAYLDQRSAEFARESVFTQIEGQPRIPLAEGGEGLLFIVSAGSSQVVLKEFSDGNRVSREVGGEFKFQTTAIRNGDGLALAAARLDEVAAPRGIRIYAPPYAETSEALVTPLYDRPNFEHLGFMARGIKDLGSRRLERYAKQFLRDHPDFNFECSRHLGIALEAAYKECGYDLKDSDFLVIDAEFVDPPQPGVSVPGSSKLLRATFLLMDLH